MNNPINVLTDEHILITKACQISEKIGKLIGKKDEEYENTARKLISVFKEYGDTYHHFKEEQLLFPEMNKKNELLEDGIIKEMFENHECFRELLKEIEKFLDKKDFLRAQQQLHIYTEALLDHIAVEDDEVFQIAESLFTPGELENIYFRFMDCDNELGQEKKKHFEQIVQQINTAL